MFRQLINSVPGAFVDSKPCFLVPLSGMGRIDTKAKHRRPVSETALPSRGQRKRALKKASLIKKISLTERLRKGTGGLKVWYMVHST